ncbi:MAG: DMT family transporter [Rhodobacterales bacterium]|nr:DMT family transporter [Rhodobacterales bacterium]
MQVCVTGARQQSDTDYNGLKFVGGKIKGRQIVTSAHDIPDTKRVPSGEAALLSSLEAPLAPLWAWMIFAEMPPRATFIGGALILTAVVGSQIRRNARGTNC